MAVLLCLHISDFMAFVLLVFFLHFSFFWWLGKAALCDCGISLIYGKYPKIQYFKVANKMIYANSADPDQTAPSGAV